MKGLSSTDSLNSNNNNTNHQRRRPMATCWQDTSAVAKTLGMSNRKLLALLENNALLRRTLSGREVLKAGKPYCRSQQREWILGQAESYADCRQPYWVIQLNQAGVAFVKEQMQQPN